MSGEFSFKMFFEFLARCLITSVIMYVIVFHTEIVGINLLLVNLIFLAWCFIPLYDSLRKIWEKVK